MAGMHFVADWPPILTGFESPVRPSKESYRTLTWQSCKVATSRAPSLKSRRRYSSLSDHSNMHLICTSRCSETAVGVTDRRENVR